MHSPRHLRTSFHSSCSPLAIILILIVLSITSHVLCKLASLHHLTSWHAIFIVSLLATCPDSHAAICLLIATVSALTQHNDLILCLSVLPSSENEQVRSDCSRCVTKTNRRGLAQVLALLPRHGVCRPNLEVVALLLSSLVLEPCTGCLGPSTKHNDVRTRDIHGVAETMLGWGATHTESRPDVRLSVEHSDVVQIALLEGSALFATTGTLHVLLIEPESAVDDQVGANQDSTVALTG